MLPKMQAIKYKKKNSLISNKCLGKHRLDEKCLWRYKSLKQVKPNNNGHASWWLVVSWRTFVYYWSIVLLPYSSLESWTYDSKIEILDQNQKVILVKNWKIGKYSFASWLFQEKSNLVEGAYYLENYIKFAKIATWSR